MSAMLSRVKGPKEKGTPIFLNTNSGNKWHNVWRINISSSLTALSWKINTFKDRLIWKKKRKLGKAEKDLQSIVEQTIKKSSRSTAGSGSPQPVVIGQHVDCSHRLFIDNKMTFQRIATVC